MYIIVYCFLFFFCCCFQAFSSFAPFSTMFSFATFFVGWWCFSFSFPLPEFKYTYPAYNHLQNEFNEFIFLLGCCALNNPQNVYLNAKANRYHIPSPPHPSHFHAKYIIKNIFFGVCLTSHFALRNGCRHSLISHRWSRVLLVQTPSTTFLCSKNNNCVSLILILFSLNIMRSSNQFFFSYI